jgi:AcrR family transcriptional regulator
MGEVKRGDRRRTRGELLVQASRRDILEAAHRLFVERGYVATSIPAIAAEAGVAVQTIYNTVGSKREVLGGVIELAVRGPHYPATPSDTIGERIRAAGDPGVILDLLADWLAEAHARSAAIYLAIRQAAAVDADAAELEHALSDERFSRYNDAARELARRGGLRAGLTPDGAAATIWSLGHPDTYRYLSQRRRWSAGRYRQWLTDELSAALRPPE